MKKELIDELKKAYEECSKAQVALYNTVCKHAPLCIRVLNEIGDVPTLKNNAIAKRKHDTDGRGVLSIDFWSHEDMISSLYEHVTEGRDYAST